MRERKFKYILKAKDGEITTKIFTYEQVYSGMARLTVMQSNAEVVAVAEWTGRTDKNRREVYEKDALKTILEDYDNLEEFVYVSWDETGSSWIVCDSDGRFIDILYLFKNGDFEVVGNVWQGVGE